MLKTITTVIENKTFDAKQTKYTILEDIKFHKFRLNTPPIICHVFHVDKLRAALANFLFSQISNDNHPGPTIIGNENGTHEYDVETILKKKTRLPVFNQMERICSFYLGTSFNYGKKNSLDEFETNLN